MTEMQFTDEQLMAFADGVADPNDAAKIEAAMAKDADIARRVSMFRQTASRLSDLAAAQSARVPDTLVTKVQELARTSNKHTDPNVIDLADARAKPRSSWIGLPLAASVFLAIGAAVTYFALDRGGSGTTADLQVAGLNHPAVKTALDTLPSGAREDVADAGEIALIATFTNADDEICREFELDHPERRTIVSVACHDGAGWDVRLAIAAAPAADTGYAPASSLETLEAYLSATQASAPLTVDAEVDALKILEK